MVSTDEVPLIVKGVHDPTERWDRISLGLRNQNETTRASLDPLVRKRDKAAVYATITFVTMGVIGLLLFFSMLGPGWLFAFFGTFFLGTMAFMTGVGWVLKGYESEVADITCKLKRDESIMECTNPNEVRHIVRLLQADDDMTVFTKKKLDLSAMATAGVISQEMRVRVKHLLDKRAIRMKRKAEWMMEHQRYLETDPDLKVERQAIGNIEDLNGEYAVVYQELLEDLPWPVRCTK